jgi:fatty acid desaturase
MGPRRIIVHRGYASTTYHDYGQLWRILHVTHHKGTKRHDDPNRRTYMIGQ